MGFEANPNASSGRKVSIANGSEGGRLRRRSDSDRGEKVLASRNNKLEGIRHSRLTRIRTAKGTNEEIASLLTLNPKASDTTAGES